MNDFNRKKWILIIFIFSTIVSSGQHNQKMLEIDNRVSFRIFPKEKIGSLNKILNFVITNSVDSVDFNLLSNELEAIETSIVNYSFDENHNFFQYYHNGNRPDLLDLSLELIENNFFFIKKAIQDKDLQELIDFPTLYFDSKNVVFGREWFHFQKDFFFSTEVASFLEKNNPLYSSLIDYWYMAGDLSDNVYLKEVDIENFFLVNTRTNSKFMLTKEGLTSLKNTLKLLLSSKIPFVLRDIDKKIFQEMEKILESGKYFVIVNIELGD